MVSRCGWAVSVVPVEEGGASWVVSKDWRWLDVMLWVSGGLLDGRARREDILLLWFREAGVLFSSRRDWSCECRNILCL